MLMLTQNEEEVKTNYWQPIFPQAGDVSFSAYVEEVNKQTFTCAV